MKSGVAISCWLGGGLRRTDRDDGQRAGRERQTLTHLGSKQRLRIGSGRMLEFPQGLEMCFGFPQRF